jgi:hypothetical protein
MIKCAICGCELNRKVGVYGTATIDGRSHASKHHYVAKRFFSRSASHKGKPREPIFKECPWGLEDEPDEYCYDCHEELLHNPIFLPKDIEGFCELVRRNGFSEGVKTDSSEKLAGRIKLLHEVLERGIEGLLEGKK